MTCAGVDGCRGGWVCVAAAGTGRRTAFVAASFASVMARLGARTTVAVDMPIGLPEAGPRACDVEARALLGRGRGSSVFSAPVRAVLGSRTHAEACRRHVGADGRRLSVQAFHLLPKIAEVDAWLAAHPRRAARVVEAHPEVAWARWGGAPITAPKRTADGHAARRALLDGEWPGAFEAAAAAVVGPGCARDDLADAFACLWVARRVAAGTAVTMPTRPPRDAAGRPMRIVS